MMVFQAFSESSSNGDWKLPPALFTFTPSSPNVLAMASPMPR